MNFSTILAGFIFGVIGIYVLREAKKRGNFALAFTGFALMFYSYFVPNAWLTWAAGFGLCWLAYRFR